MNLNQNNSKQTNYQSRKRQSDRSVIDMALQNAHGKIPYGMTNDYMFRAVLQSNNKVLRGLICSLLHLTEKEVFSVEIDEAKSVIHIGFLDYTLFRNHPEFYATYKLINVKNYQKYSDNITLNVVDLSRIDLATEEDKAYHIDGWAKLLLAEVEKLKARA